MTPDGAGLPVAKGSVAGGRRLYAKLCASCHGPGGEGGPIDRLAGGQGSLATGRPVKTIGSFRPYPTTLFEYVRRAMPFNPPQSLAAEEVYALTGKPALTGINAGRLRAGTIALSDCRGRTMHRLLKRALGGALLLSVFAGAAWAQDKFANCPDPEAARKHVKECLAANPYNTQEVCEERALEKLCRKK